MKSLKRRRESRLEVAERQAAATREVIDALRKLQQDLRALWQAQHGFERRQEQLALAFIRCATSVGGTPPTQPEEVSRG